MTDVIANCLKRELGIDESLDAGMPQSVRTGPMNVYASPPEVQRCDDDTAALVMGERGANTLKNTCRSWVCGRPFWRYSTSASPTTLASGYAVQCPALRSGIWRRSRFQSMLSSVTFAISCARRPQVTRSSEMA